jgi:hypothetical protein
MHKLCTFFKNDVKIEHMNDAAPPELFTLIVAMSSSIAIVIGAWFAISRLIAPAVKKIKEIGQNLDNFIEDWHGTPARDGRDSVPGVMERLNKIDGELTHNGGSSVKDAVARIESGIIKINERLEEGDKKFHEIEDRLEDI